MVNEKPYSNSLYLADLYLLNDCIFPVAVIFIGWPDVLVRNTNSTLKTCHLLLLLYIMKDQYIMRPNKLIYFTYMLSVLNQ